MVNINGMEKNVDDNRKLVSLRENHVVYIVPRQTCEPQHSFASFTGYDIPHLGVAIRNQLQKSTGVCMSAYLKPI